MFFKAIRCEHLRGCASTYDTDVYINVNHIEYFSGDKTTCNIRLNSGYHIEIKMPFNELSKIIEGAKC